MDSISGSRSIPVTPQTDEAFDAFWEEEARNPHRNRIRIGRTYQASIPPKLKQGESDGRKLEDLETIYWHKQPVSKNEELNEYFSVAKLVSLFTRYKMFQKSKSEEDSSSQQSSKTSNESTVANNGIGNKEEVRNGCVNEPSHQSLDQQLMDIYNFVSSHHPPAKNEGCSSSSATSASHKDEWTVKEARLFASALEIYGKNFGAIKKAIPWKPVKSLIDHYYSSNEDGTSDEDDDYMSPKETEFLSAKSKNQTFQTLTVATCLTPQVSTLFNDFSLKQDFSIKDSNGNGIIVPGQEVKPLKGKPVMKNQVNSLLGSLKFFMDGQLVLKLNAKQQEMNKKCSWVESLDTPKIPRPVFKKKHFPRSFKLESMDSGSMPDSGRSSVRSDETESSDDDSLGSADSRSLLDSPSFVPRFRTGTKIKVESNCQVPPFPFIASPPSSHLPSSHPSTPYSMRDGSVNESSKLCKSDNQKRGVSESNLLHALLLPEAKKRLKMSPKSSDPHHDLLLTNNHDEVKMKLIQDRLEFPSLYSPFRTSSHGQAVNGEINAAVDLSCKPSPKTNSSSESPTTNSSSESPKTNSSSESPTIKSCSEAIDLSSNQKGCNKSKDDEESKDMNVPPNWLQSYLPFYEQYYRYCSQSDQSGSSRRAAQSVSPPNHSTGEEIQVPSRPKSTSSTTPSPKEKRKSDWSKKSGRK